MCLRIFLRRFLMTLPTGSLALFIRSAGVIYGIPGPKSTSRGNAGQVLAASGTLGDAQPLARTA